MHVVSGCNRATTPNALGICDGLVRRKDAVGDGNGAVRGDRATLKEPSGNKLASLSNGRTCKF
jgi:hypothetical protein